MSQNGLKWSLCPHKTSWLRLEDTYAAIHMKIIPPLHVCLNNSVVRPSLKILSGVSQIF